MTNTVAITIGCLGLAASITCSRNGNPLSAPEGSLTTATTVAGVSIDAEVDAWPGDDGVLSEVTPVRLAIKNESNHPVSFQYENFEIVVDDGTVYHALPPFQIEGSIKEVTTVYDPIADPGFAHEGFSIAPHYRRIYPGIGVYEGLDPYDPYYNDNYYRIWHQIDLPTAEMIQRALPEGVIDQKGQLSGFLYFERVDEKKGQATLRAKLVNPQTKEILGTAEILFAIEE